MQLLFIASGKFFIFFIFKYLVFGVAGSGGGLTIFICFLLKQNCKTAQPIKDINTIQEFSCKTNKFFILFYFLFFIRILWITHKYFNNVQKGYPKNSKLFVFENSFMSWS